MTEPSASLVQDVLRGDPAAAAELHRLQESDVRGRFQGSREGFLSRVMGRALLGRSRSPSAALTREEERLLEQTRPDLRYSSAAASPEKTYPGSRLATTPAIAALPAAGLAAGAGYLSTLPTDLPSWAKSLITAGSAGLGGVAGSTAAHVLRQRHARTLRREEPKSASLVEQLVPYATGVLVKEAGTITNLLRRMSSVFKPGIAEDVVKGTAAIEPAAAAALQSSEQALAHAMSMPRYKLPDYKWGTIPPGLRGLEDPRTTAAVLADPAFRARIHSAAPSLPPAPVDPDAFIRSALQQRPESAIDLSMLHDTLRGKLISTFDPRVLSRAGLPANEAAGALGSLPFNTGAARAGAEFLPVSGGVPVNVIPRSPQEILDVLEWRKGGIPGTGTETILPPPPAPIGSAQTGLRNVHGPVAEGLTMFDALRAPQAGWSASQVVGP